MATQTFQLLQKDNLEKDDYNELGKNFLFFELAESKEIFNWINRKFGKYYQDLKSEGQNKLNKLEEIFKESLDKQEISRTLIKVKKFGENVIQFKKLTDKFIPENAGELLKHKPSLFVELLSYLQENSDGGVGL